MPANRRAWPEGSTFYRYDKIYDRRNFGYRGPGFGLPPMPDQYVLEALQRLELARAGGLRCSPRSTSSRAMRRGSSIPRLIPWDDVGDGSIFDRLPAPRQAAPATRPARAAYARSIEYTLRTVLSFVRRYGDDDLVLVVLGDHQPATTITGQGASHDVPISLIAHDPTVLTGSPDGAGRTACGRARRRRSGRWTRSATAS